MTIDYDHEHDDVQDTGQDTPEAPQDAAGASQGPADTGAGQDAHDDHPEVRRARQEAKGLRTRLRDAEAARDTATSMLDAMRAAEVVRLAGQHLADGTDLARFGTEVADLLDDAGAVDPEKVTEAAKALAAARPHLAPRRFGSVDAGPRNVPSTRATAETSWSQALSGRR